MKMKMLKNGLTVVVIALLILGITKMFDFIYAFAPQRVPDRVVTITEAAYMKRGDDLYVKSEANVSYSTEYLKGFRYLEQLSITREEQEFLYMLCKDYEISYSLALAIMDVESSFNAGIISTTGDYGLMQINVTNHEWLQTELGVSDFLNSYENMRSGMYILADLFAKYSDVGKVLMAYNMGEEGAEKLWSQGIYMTNYVATVAAKHEHYREMLK